MFIWRHNLAAIGSSPLATSQLQYGIWRRAEFRVWKDGDDMYYIMYEKVG